MRGGRSGAVSKWVLAPITAGLLAACATPAPRDLVGDGWLELRSSDLSLVTNAGEKRAVILIEKLQQFREIVRQHAGAPVQAPRVPLSIYVDESRVRFHELLGRNSIGVLGISMSQESGHQLALHDDQSGRGLAVLLHEYSHFLLRNQWRFRYPRWYNEGFAEFVAPVFSSDVPALGNLNPLRYRAEGMELLDLGSLITDRPYRGDGHRFYTTAWLLVHYLHLSGADGGPERLPQLLAFLKRYADGASSREAFAGAFDISLAELHEELASYSKRKRFYRIKLDLKRYASSVPIGVRSLAPAEVAVHAGNIALTAGQSKIARVYYQSALTTAGSRQRALAGLGVAAAQRHRYSEARELFERALTSGPPDAQLLNSYADLIAARARDRIGRSDAERSAEFGRAQELYRRAIALAPELAAPHAGLGASFLELPDPDPAAAVAPLERAYQLLASENEVLYSLARAYVGVGRIVEARRLLEDVVSWEDHGAFGPEARALLAELARSYPADPEAAGQSHSEELAR